MHNISIVTLGTQYVDLVFRTGPFKGDTVSAKNILQGQKRVDKIYKEGDMVFTVSRVSPEGKHIDTRADDFYRLNVELILVITFVGMLIFVAGFTGVKSALSFIFTAVAFWKLLIPAFLNGYSPFFVSIGVVFISTMVIILLVGGLSRRGIVALCGSLLGVVVTALLAIVFGHYFKIPGTVQDYAEPLLYAGFTELNFSEMFISCVFISSAGAVMDVAMDIAAAQDELSAKAPNMSTKELIRSGLNTASPVIGSMTTTLLFAYSGNFMFAFMAFMAQGLPVECILNRGFISAEILLTLVGSFGLVLVAPITAIIGGYICKFKMRV